MQETALALNGKVWPDSPSLLTLAGLDKRQQPVTAPVSDRRKRRAAKAQAKAVASSGVAPVGPMQLLLPALCKTSTMSAYERWSSKVDALPMRTISGWEKMALDAAHEAFALGRKHVDLRELPILTPTPVSSLSLDLPSETWETSTYTPGPRKPVAMSIASEGI